MKHYRIFILAALAALAASCSVKEDLQPSSRAIRFTTNLGAYTTRATDTAFEEGDAVSLFAEYPINALNVKMTYNGDDLVPEKAIFWPEGMQDGEYATNFFAVYPYRQDWEDLSSLNVFSVNADQRTHELYTASDLLGASYMAFPDCETVPLNFTHLLSKVQCEINGLDGEKVADVYLADVYGKVRVSIGGSMSASSVGDKGSVRMGQTGSWDNGVYFSAVLPPQAMDFRVLVITESGKQYTFKRPGYYDTAYMEPARKYFLYLYLHNAEPESEFDVEVSDWTDDNDVQFGNYIPDEYQNEGSWYLVTTDENGEDSFTYMPYQAYYYNFIESCIEAGDNASYRIQYRIGRRVTSYGLKTGELTAGQYALVEDGEPFSWNGNVPVTLNYNLYDKILTVKEDTDVWSVIGSFDGWQGDQDMTRVSHGVYTIDLEYWNEEFKFRCNRSWDVNIGNYDDDVFYDLPEGYAFFTLPDGYNIRLESPGIWRLTLDVIRQRLHVAYVEELTDSNFDALAGNWSYALSDSLNVDIAIEKNGYNLLISYDGWPVSAVYNHKTASFDVQFQTLREWQWGSYGLTYDWFRGSYSKPDDDGVYWLWGNMSDLVLFSGALAADGTLDIQPGLSYDGYPFNAFDIVAAIQEGDYQGYYAPYYDTYFLFPLPQTWTRVNN